MNITLRGVSEQLDLANVEPAWTVDQLRQAIGTRLRTPVEPGRLRLLYQGRVLRGEQTMAEIGVSSGDTVHMIVAALPTNEASPAAGPQTPAPLPAFAQAGPAGGINIAGLLGAVTGAIQSSLQPQMQPAIAPPPFVPRAPVPNAATAQDPPAAAPTVHVHLHVSLAELEQVPAAIERMRARMGAAPPAIQVHTTAAAPAAPLAQPRSAPASAAAPPVPAPAAALVPQLMRSSLSGLQMPQLMALGTGSWAPLAALYPAWHGIVTQFLGTDTTDAVRSQRLDQEAHALVEALRSSVALGQVAASGLVAPGQHFWLGLEGIVAAALRQLTSFVLQNPADNVQAWCAAFRQLVVALVGASTLFLDSTIGVGGTGLSTATLNVLINEQLPRAVTAAAPQYAGFLPLMQMQLRNTIAAWNAEYRGRAPSLADARSFLFPPAGAPAATTTPVVSAAPVARARSATDDLLDDALNELPSRRPEPVGGAQPTQGQPTSATSMSPTALQEQLQRFGVPTELARRAANDVTEL